VVRYHLGKHDDTHSGLLSDFSRIYIAGDHGAFMCSLARHALFIERLFVLAQQEVLRLSFFVGCVVHCAGLYFSSTQTFWDESTFRALYGVEFIPIFLCSYHAFNRCVCVQEDDLCVSLILFDFFCYCCFSGARCLCEWLWYVCCCLSCSFSGCVCPTYGVHGFTVATPLVWNSNVKT
jgi:hypothetical protein